jgi:hypothetical protein
MRFLSDFGDARISVISSRAARFFLAISMASMASSCLSHPKTKAEPEVIVQHTPHRPSASYPKIKIGDMMRIKSSKHDVVDALW